MGRYITATGTAGSVIRSINSSSITTYTAVVNDRILVNTTTAAVTITLPSSVVDGDTVQIIDVGGVAGTNNITVLRNGFLINGLTNDLLIDLSGSISTLISRSSPPLTAAEATPSTSFAIFCNFLEISLVRSKVVPGGVWMMA